MAIFVAMAIVVINIFVILMVVAVIIKINNFVILGQK
jgi:hypothetical protein